MDAETHAKIKAFLAPACEPDDDVIKWLRVLFAEVERLRDVRHPDRSDMSAAQARIDAALAIREAALAVPVQLPNEGTDYFASFADDKEAAEFWFNEWKHLNDEWARGWRVAAQMAWALEEEE